MRFAICVLLFSGLMEEGNGALCLSRHFDLNVILVARICSKCYRECDDLKIVGVNKKFLQRYQMEEKSKDFEGTDIECKVRNVSSLKIENFEEDLAFHQIGPKKEEERLFKSEIPCIKVEDFDDAKVFPDGNPSLTVETGTDCCRAFGGIEKSDENDSFKSQKCDSSYERSEDFEEIASASSSCLSQSTDEASVEEESQKIEVIPKNEGSDQIVTTKSPRKSTKVNLKSLQRQQKPEEAISSSQTSTSSRSSTNTWTPPRSPHNLIEESLYHDPWSLLVATIFLNRTSCASARPFVEKFLEDHPEPASVLRKRPEDLEPYFELLGLRKRAEHVWRMTRDYVGGGWKDVGELYGIGRYGRDAYRMFCLGDLEVEPTDRFLRIYKGWYQQEGRNLRGGGDGEAGGE